MFFASVTHPLLPTATRFNFFSSLTNSNLILDCFCRDFTHWRAFFFFCLFFSPSDIHRLPFDLVALLPAHAFVPRHPMYTGLVVSVRPGDFVWYLSAIGYS